MCFIGLRYILSLRHKKTLKIDERGCFGVENLIQNINKKMNEDGTLSIEFEFKDNQSEDEVKTIKEFTLSLIENLL